MEQFRALFSTLPDPRAANARHDLSEILLIGFAAVLCGAESCVDMAEFGAAKQPLLKRMLLLKSGVPSHDTFSRVFRLLDPLAFEPVFRQFTAGFAARLSELGDVIALDGKSVSAACETGARSTPLHLVCAWAAAQRLVLAQRRAPNRNEVQAALELVALLDLEGCILTADALHGTQAMTAAIRDRGGDYVLALKANRGPLFRATQALLESPDPDLAAVTTEQAHGRHEQRQAVVLPVPADWPERFRFKDLAAVARIDAIRRTGDKEERQTRYFVLSRPFEPLETLRIVRAHWGIENQLHWVLDVVFDEDRARARKDNAGENLALLRRLALNLLRADPYKAAIRRKIKRAGWEDEYLYSLICQMR